jgi:hypothetical protein
VLRSIGLPELLIILTVLAYPFLVFPFWKIFSKAGYPGIMGIAMLVPFLNVVMLFFLGFSDWPVLRELTTLRQKSTSLG